MVHVTLLRGVLLDDANVGRGEIVRIMVWASAAVLAVKDGVVRMGGMRGVVVVTRGCVVKPA